MQIWVLMNTNLNMKMEEVIEKMNDVTIHTGEIAYKKVFLFAAMMLSYVIAYFTHFTDLMISIIKPLFDNWKYIDGIIVLSTHIIVWVTALVVFFRTLRNKSFKKAVKETLKR